MAKQNQEAIYDARTLGKGKMLVLGFQHMFAMFGATVLVPLLTGLDIATTLLTVTSERNIALRRVCKNHSSQGVISVVPVVVFSNAS